MLLSQSTIAHSAQVRMRLEVGGVRLSITQLGPDFAIFGETPDFTARHCEIALQVDPGGERWMVELPDGPAPAGQRTRIVNLS